MKRHIIAIAVLLCGLTAHAQEQSGYVKTRGRMVNGVHVPGTGLTGAFVSVKDGNSIGVHEADGSFSFPVRGNTYTIQSVKKKDYVLVDADALPKTYAYSSNPLYLVMETPDQLLEDQLEAESRIRRTLQKQLDERKKELETLKEQARITQEEYRAAMLKLYDDQGNEEKLIRDMAQRYSQIDYDQLDDFYRRVSSFIEAGDLAKADSLLRSRGNLHEQVNTHIKRGEAIQHEEEELQKAKEVYQHDMDEMARRCFSYYESFSMRHQRDSAAHYLQLRAKLDTTNMVWQTDAGEYVKQYLADYDSDMTYFQRSLDVAIRKYGEDHLDVATLYDHIGSVYLLQGNFVRCHELFFKALEIRKCIMTESDPLMAVSYNNLGSVYEKMEDYAKAMECLIRALDISGENQAVAAVTCNSIGLVYNAMGDYAKALEYHYRSLSIRRQIYGENHYNVAMAYHNIADDYYDIGDLEKTLEYNKMSLEIWQKVYGNTHPQVAVAHNNIASAYYALEDYGMALEHLHTALEILEDVHAGFHPDVAMVYDNYAMLYHVKGDNEKALEYLDLSLNIRREARGESHPDVALSYETMGVFYQAEEKYDVALEYFNLALNVRRQAFGDVHPDVSRVYDSIALVWQAKGDYAKAMDCFNLSLDIRKEILGECHLEIAKKYDTIALFYSSHGDYANAMEYHHNALEIRRKLYGDLHSEHIASYSLIGVTCMLQQDYQEGCRYLKKAYEVSQKVFGIDHKTTQDLKMQIENLETMLEEQN